MKTLKPAAALALLPALLVVLTSCTFTSNPARYKETRTLAVKHIPGSALRVVSENGAISVRASEREDVEIVADLRMTSPERLEATEILTTRDDADRLSIQVTWPEGRKRRNEACSFTIALPDARDVELRTANGQLRMSGLSGKAELSTSNGRIEVQDHGGDVRCRTSNGSVTVEASDGDIDVRSSNGRIEIRNAKSMVKAETSNGSVRIDLAGDGSGPVTAQSSNGSINLQLGASFQGELELGTSNGSLDANDLSNPKVLSLSKHHARLKFGESSSKSKVVTSNGSIRVRGG